MTLEERIDKDLELYFISKKGTVKKLIEKYMKEARREVAEEVMIFIQADMQEVMQGYPHLHLRSYFDDSKRRWDKYLKSGKEGE